MIELMRDYDDADEHLQRPARQARGLEARGEPRDAADRRAVQAARSGAHARAADQPEPPADQSVRHGRRAWRIGLALVALLEYRDRSFKTDDEIISLLALPVLAVVPLMQSDAERRRRVRRRLLLGCRPRQHGRRLSGRPGLHVRPLRTRCTKHFFGLRERPFDLTPNPRFLVLTESHREALMQPRVRHRQPQGHHAAASARPAPARRR